MLRRPRLKSRREESSRLLRRMMAHLLQKSVEYSEQPAVFMRPAKDRSMCSDRGLARHGTDPGTISRPPHLDKPVISEERFASIVGHTSQCRSAITQAQVASSP